jgi:hypothetical protein
MAGQSTGDLASPGDVAAAQPTSIAAFDRPTGYDGLELDRLRLYLRRRYGGSAVA